MTPINKLPGRFKLITFLALSTVIGLLLWSDWHDPLPLFAQSPLSTPAIGDIYIKAKYPHPPTPTPTRIPDDIPPQTTMVTGSVPNSQNWYRAPITLTFVTTDNMTGLGITWHKFSRESDWQKHFYYSPPFAVTTEGAHTLEFYSEDKNSNIEAAHTEAINLDWTPPTASHTLDGLYILNGWYGSPVTVNLAGQDNLAGIAHYEVNLNGSGWLPTTASPRISATGHHTLTYRAVDRAGNVSAEEIITLNVDTKPPTTTHIFSGSLASNGWYHSPVTVTLTAADTGAGLFEIKYRLEGGPAWLTYGGPFVVDTDGPHTLEYYATDRVNNIEAAHTVNFDLDLTAPASAHPTVIGLAGANDWHISPITITLTAIDGQAEVDYIEYNWRQSSWLTYTPPLTTPNEGVHHLAFRAVDETGHIETTQQFTAMVDLSPPLVTIEPVPVLTLSNIILTDIYTAADDVSGINTLTATIGGQPVQAGQRPPLGTNTLVVTAINGAGQQATASQIIVVEGVNLYLPFILKSPPPCDFPPFCW